MNKKPDLDLTNPSAAWAEVFQSLGLPAYQVRVETKDCRAMQGVVAANALEHAGAVVQSMGRHVDRGVLPGNYLAVLPGEFALREKGHFRTPMSSLKGLGFR